MKINITYEEACALMKAIVERAGTIDNQKYYTDMHISLLASAYRKLEIVKNNKSRTP